MSTKLPIGLLQASAGATAGQALLVASNGEDIEVGDISAGIWETIEESNTFSGASNQDFTGWKDNTKYDAYRFKMMAGVSVSNADVNLLTSTNNGVSFDTGSNYDYHINAREISGDNVIRSADGGTNVPLLDSTSGTGIIEFEFWNIAQAPTWLRTLYFTNNGAVTSNFATQHGFFSNYTASTNMDAIRLSASSGNVNIVSYRIQGHIKPVT